MQLERSYTPPNCRPRRLARRGRRLDDVDASGIRLTWTGTTPARPLRVRELGPLESADWSADDASEAQGVRALVYYRNRNERWHADPPGTESARDPRAAPIAWSPMPRRRDTGH